MALDAEDIRLTVDWQRRAYAATETRIKIAGLSAAERQPREAEIMAYLAAIRAWEARPDTHPFPAEPRFLTQVPAPAQYSRSIRR